MDTTVPPNTSALVLLPTPAGKSVTENGKPVKELQHIFSYKREGNQTAFRIGSGTHSFRIGK